jgi:hypothetical protein
VSFAPGGFTGCDEGPPRHEATNRDAPLTLAWLDPNVGARSLTARFYCS